MKQRAILSLWMIFLNIACASAQWILQSRGVNIRDIECPTPNDAIGVGQYGWIVRTTDAGETWRIKRIATNDLLSIDFVSPQVGWAVGGGSGSTFGVSLILKTTDGGANWLVQDSGSYPRLTSVHFRTEFNGWAAGDGGCILRTTDGGSSWIQAATGGRNAARIAFSSNTRGWVANLSLRQSTDSGISWFQTNLNRAPLNVQFVDSLVGWMYADTHRYDYEQEALLKTTDGGDNWFNQSFPYDRAFWFWGSMFFLDRSHGWVPRVVNGVRRTTDGGSTWEAANFPTVGTIFSIKFTSPDIGLFASDYTILKTSDGGASWNTSLFATGNGLRGVDFVDSTHGWAVGDGTVVLHTSNGGNSWQAQRGISSGTFVSISAVSRNVAYAIGPGIIFKTSNGGTSWLQLSAGSTVNLKSVYFINADTGWTCGWEHPNWRMLRTTNGGTTWDTWLLQRPYLGLYFLDGALGYAIFNEEVDRTTDGGATWAPSGWASQPFLKDVFFLNPQTGWIVGDYGTIWKTSDAGNSWFPQTSPVGTILTKVRFANSNIGWICGGNRTILKTTNGGTTWFQQVGGVLWDNFWGLDVIGEHSAWIVGESGTIIALSESTTTSSPPNENFHSPTEFALHLNYPNPFNPSTTISFSIPHSSFITLKVFDVLGREVATLVDEEMRPGRYERQFDGNNLASGVYLCRMQAGVFIQTKKFLLMR